jgi:SRSO17 transposase
VVRERQADGSWKYDYYLCHTPPNTPLAELVRVTRAAHRIEECFRRGKSEAGLADYEVRTWEGWYHHQTLALLATWFLTLETRRGKKSGPSHHRPPSPLHHRQLAASATPGRLTEANRSLRNAAAPTQRRSTAVPP